MLSIRPNYILEGCPIELTFTTESVKRVLVFYGRKSYWRKTSNRLVFYAKKEKNSIRCYVWSGFFIKKHKVTFKVHSFKTTNLEDLPLELSGTVQVDGFSVHAQTPQADPVIEQVELIGNQLSFHNKKVLQITPVNINENIRHLNLELKKIDSVERFENIFENEEFYNFRKEAIKNIN